jgi:hypothetical protein
LCFHGEKNSARFIEDPRTNAQEPNGKAFLEFPTEKFRFALYDEK